MSEKIDFETLVEIDALQARYVRALDSRDMSGWVGCFRDGSSYICSTRESDEQDLPLALMMDDNYQRILDRVKFIEEVWTGTFEDYTMRHVVQRLSCQKNERNLVEVESNFLVSYTTRGGRSELLSSGVYVDLIDLNDGEAYFRAKKSIIDTSTTPRYVVYPL